MKIQFLGTGSITSKSNPSSYLIDEKLLIDCGNGIVKTILNTDNNIYEIDTLLITHLHGDHILDIPFLILMRGFIDINNILTIYGPKRIKETIKDLIRASYSELVDDWDNFIIKAKVEFIEIEENEYQINDYHLKVFDVEHGSFKPAFGFIINNKIGFSGDSALSNKIEEMLKTVEYGILDNSFLNGGSSHMGLDILKELSLKYPQTILIPTHMNDEVRIHTKQLDNKNIQVYDDLDILII